jgi:hypothetical protein
LCIGPIQEPLLDDALFHPAKDQAAGELAQRLTSIRSACDGWLLLNLFLARLWRDAAAADWALYSLWALRNGLEDLPTPLPISAAHDEGSMKRDANTHTPAYVALVAETASLWLQTTAPLMYGCEEIWGPNGRDDWPSNRGAPGRGGKKWDGVDGFDKEHQRWALWKSVLREVVQWCDDCAKDVKFRIYRTKEAAERALQAMDAAESDGTQ